MFSLFESLPVGLGSLEESFIVRFSCFLSCFFLVLFSIERAPSEKALCFQLAVSREHQKKPKGGNHLKYRVPNKKSAWENDCI